MAGSCLLVGVEILMARGAPRLDGYTREQLDGLIGAGPGRALRVVWIGDSTGDGVGVSAPDRVLPRLVARGLGRPVELTVLANSGDRVEDAIRDQLPVLRAIDADWVFVGIGSNDVIHVTPRGRFREQLDELLRGVVAGGVRRTIVLGIGEFASTPLFAQPLRFLAGARGHQLTGDIADAARRHGALYVDIRARTGGRFVEDPVRYHARDRFHPSDEGYRLWAEAILDALGEAGALTPQVDERPTVP